MFGFCLIPSMTKTCINYIFLVRYLLYNYFLKNMGYNFLVLKYNVYICLNLKIHFWLMLKLFLKTNYIRRLEFFRGACHTRQLINWLTVKLYDEQGRSYYSCGFRRFICGIKLIWFPLNSTTKNKSINNV